MSLDSALKSMKFDSRLLEYNLSAGIITKEEYEAYIKSLPDDSANSMPLKIEGTEGNQGSH